MSLTSGSNLLLVWKATACLWCLSRGEARFTQVVFLVFFPPKDNSNSSKFLFSREELVGRLHTVAMETHKEKKQPNS